ncbi:hypothetical protein NL676_030460 [Syzygium grande]|nr:hypothetical protein NL676_030460 [Syzygium grande]
MEFKTVIITMISAPNPNADEVKLSVSLSGDPRQQIPIYEDPRRACTFFFTVDKAVAPSLCLKFQIDRANSTCLEKDVGTVDVPVGDLFVNGSSGDVRQEALSYQVRSSSGETKGVLGFYCQLVTSYPAAAASHASRSVAAYPPPTHGAPPPPLGYAPAAYPPAGGISAPPAAYPYWYPAPPPAAYTPPPTAYPPPPTAYPYWYPAPPPAGYPHAGCTPPGHGSSGSNGFVLTLVGQLLANVISQALFGG